MTIENNDISEQAAGIQISYTAGGDAILNNLIHDNNRMIVNTTSPTNDDHGANGVIFLETTGATLASGNELWGNRAPSHDYGYDGSAFEIYGASDVTITDNQMWNNKQVMETGTDGRACNNLTFTRNVAWSGTSVAGWARGVLIACASNSLIAFNTLDGFDISDVSIVYNAGYMYQGSESGPEGGRQRPDQQRRSDLPPRDATVRRDRGSQRRLEPDRRLAGLGQDPQRDDQLEHLPELVWL